MSEIFKLCRKRISFNDPNVPGDGPISLYEQNPHKLGYVVEVGNHHIEAIRSRLLPSVLLSSSNSELPDGDCSDGGQAVLLLL